MSNYKTKKDGTARVDNYKANSKMVRLSNKNVEALDEFKDATDECRSRDDALSVLLADYFRLQKRLNS